MRGMDITNVYGSVLCLGRFGVCPGSRRTGFGVGMTSTRLPGLDQGMGKVIGRLLYVIVVNIPFYVSGYNEHIEQDKKGDFIMIM